MFYSDTVLNKLVQFTNDNATKEPPPPSPPQKKTKKTKQNKTKQNKTNNNKKPPEEPEENKGEWKAPFLYTKVYNIPSVQQ